MSAHPELPERKAGQLLQSMEKVSNFIQTRQGAIDTEDYVRRIIEQRPFTTAFAALCVGWFIGRMRRRELKPAAK